MIGVFPGLVIMLNLLMFNNVNPKTFFFRNLYMSASASKLTQLNLCVNVASHNLRELLIHIYSPDNALKLYHLSYYRDYLKIQNIIE